MTDRMGYEKRIFYGTAGATATSPMPNVRDINENTPASVGDTTTRGDSSRPPIETSGPAKIGYELTFDMINKTGDAGLTAIRTARDAGTLLAIRVVDFDGGTGFDGDMWFELQESAPLDGEQLVSVTARASRALREPQLGV